MGLLDGKKALITGARKVSAGASPSLSQTKEPMLGLTTSSTTKSPSELPIWFQAAASKVRSMLAM